MRTLVWFRGKDLRVNDHAPLCDAAARGEVVCLFVLDPFFFAPARAQALPHRIQFLLESLASLEQNLASLGSHLFFAVGKSTAVVPHLAAQLRVDRVVAHRWTEPFARERDRRVAAAMKTPLELFEGETLASPRQLRTGAGTAYTVFTPFARAHRAQVKVARPLPPPPRLPPPPPGLPYPDNRPPTLRDLGIPHNPRLLAGGERAARERLRAFMTAAASRYHTERDRLDLASTSRLSADLKFGTLSARTVWTAAHDALGAAPEALKSFTNELLWREFAHACLFEMPSLLERPYRPLPDGVFRDNESHFTAWAEGTTGYPIIDAAARQLRAEGFVHNRARMITASFLTKDLLIDYRRGEAHYMRWLTDGDWAQNNAGWQWSAGCGFDAQPYFRVFNPTEQGKRFDPTGAYVRRWLPELAGLPTSMLHDPSTAPPLALREAGVTLAKTYPRPIVDHAAARETFLSLARRQDTGHLTRTGS